MKSTEQKRKEAVTRHNESLKVWEELRKSGIPGLNKLSLERVQEIEKKFAARKYKAQTFEQFCAAKIHNIEREIRLSSF